MVEQGDDRPRPAAAVHLGINEANAGKIFYYGREQGPVREETTIVSGLHRFSLFGSKSVSAAVGAAIMDEKIALKFPDPADADMNNSEDNWNVGMAFGVSWSLPPAAGPLYFSVSWDSHLFPAGLNGLLFLATGRKETVSILMGLQL